LFSYEALILDAEQASVGGHLVTALCHHDTAKTAR